MTEINVEEIRAEWDIVAEHVREHWNCCGGHRVAHRVPALIAEVERLRALVKSVIDLTQSTDGDPLDADSEIPVGELYRVLYVDVPGGA